MKKQPTTPRISEALKGRNFKKTAKCIGQMVSNIKPKNQRCFVLFDFAGLNVEQIGIITEKMRAAYPADTVVSGSSVPTYFNQKTYDMRVCTIELTITGYKVLYKGISSKIIKELLHVDKKELTLQHKVT